MRLIDADALIENMEIHVTTMSVCSTTIEARAKGEMKRTCIADVANAPTIDAIPVVHGAWINIPDKPEWDQKACSVCGDYFCCQNNFCPNCGAKMDGERRDENAADRR